MCIYILHISHNYRLMSVYDSYWVRSKCQLVNSSCHCRATCWMHVVVLFFEPMTKPSGMRDNSLKWEKNKIKIITQQMITLHKGGFSFLWRSSLSDFPVFFFHFLITLKYIQLFCRRRIENEAKEALRTQQLDPEKLCYPAVDPTNTMSTSMIQPGARRAYTLTGLPPKSRKGKGSNLSLSDRLIQYY